MPPRNPSECRLIAPICKPYMEGKTVLDVGSGGAKVVEWAETFDLPAPYTVVGDHTIDYKGDARDLSRFKDGHFDVVFSSHLLEDFPQDKCEGVMQEWRRVAREYLILYLPDQERYVEYCKARCSKINPHHKWNMCLDFILAICERNGWKIMHKIAKHADYSFFAVIDASS